MILLFPGFEFSNVGSNNNYYYCWMLGCILCQNVWHWCGGEYSKNRLCFALMTKIVPYFSTVRNSGYHNLLIKESGYFDFKGDTE